MSRSRLYFSTPRGAHAWPPPDPSHSGFFEGTPAPLLAGTVRRVRWGFERVGERVEERILPDGAAHLIVVVPEDAGREAYALVQGAHATPVVVELEGTLRHVELELQPGATLALFGVAAKDVAGATFALADVAPQRSAGLVDALRNAGPDVATAARRVQTALAKELSPVAPAPRLVRAALARVHRGPSLARVGTLAAELGVSERRLEQLFALHVGLSPKEALRLARLHRLLERLARPGSRRATWAQVAAAEGFADQSHLTHDLRRLTGLAPRALLQATGFGFLQD